MTETTNTPVKRTFKKTANVTLELLKIVAGKEYYVRFLSDMHVGKAVAPKVEIDKETGEVKKVNKEPAMVAFVDDLETDQERIIIVSTVLRKELAEAYPNASYVGRTFGFKQTRVAGKDYNLVELWEVEDPDTERSTKVAADWAAKVASKAPTLTTEETALGAAAVDAAEKAAPAKAAKK